MSLFTEFVNSIFDQIVERKDYTESGTKEFDRMAFRYLGIVFFLYGK
jgi:hypothetical protein